MIDKKKLCKFLVKAKKATYAAGATAKKVLENDKSTTLIFDDGNWKYHDNYFGGEPFGGREVVFCKGKPIYIMTYYGLVKQSISDFEPIYKMLQLALGLVPEAHPFRGPKEYSKGGMTYKNSYSGQIDNFFGEEVIIYKGKEVYKAKYIGGLVNQKN